MPHRSIITVALLVALIAALGGFMLPIYAADSNCAIQFVPGVGIPGSKFIAGQEVSINCSSIGEYIKAIYNFSIYAGSMVAVVVMMVGGYLWLTAAGNVTQVGQAKTYIGGALSGFVLLLLSWTLLQTINPKLVEFKPLVVEQIGNTPLPVQATGCCVCRGGLSTELACENVAVQSSGGGGTCQCEVNGSSGQPFSVPAETDCVNSENGDNCQWAPSQREVALASCQSHYPGWTCTIADESCYTTPQCTNTVQLLLAQHRAGPCDNNDGKCDVLANYTCNRAWVCAIDPSGTLLPNGELSEGGCCMPPQPAGAACSSNRNCASGVCQGDYYRNAQGVCE